jgi:hypothetical protein
MRGLSELDARRLRRPGVEGVACTLRYLALVRNRRGEGQEVAGTAGAELTGKTARLWGAGTLPEHRGRGAYRALVMERCRHAHALGATLALTKVNIASSAPILRNAGLHPVASERRYALKMAAQASPRVCHPGATLDQYKPRLILYTLRDKLSRFGSASTYCGG